MNTNKKMLTRLSNSTVGRALRRLFGDECGQGMMEYVIIATVIAAAAALIFAIWGKSIIGTAAADAQVTAGEPNRGSQTIEETRRNTQNGSQEARETSEKFHGDVNTPTVVGG